MDTIVLTLAFASMTQTFNLPEGLLSSLCYVESHHKVNAIHMDDGGSPSLGICQIKYSTAVGLGYKGTARHLQIDAPTNIYYAAKYLEYQIMRYDNDVDKAIAAYNAGSYRTNKKGFIINKGYVVKVKTSWERSR